MARVVRGVPAVQAQVVLVFREYRFAARVQEVYGNRSAIDGVGPGVRPQEGQAVSHALIGAELKRLIAGIVGGLVVRQLEEVRHKWSASPNLRVQINGLH